MRATFASKANSIRSLSGGSAKAQRLSGRRVLPDFDYHVEQVAIAKEDATTADKRKERR